MQPDHVTKNVGDLIKSPRAGNNANLLSVTAVVSKAILNIIADKIMRKDDSKE